MLDYTENMIIDIKAALSVAMRRRKQYCIEWEVASGEEYEFLVFATGESDAIGQLYYKLASKKRSRESVKDIRITSVELCNYMKNNGEMVPNDGSSEFAAKYDAAFGPVPFAPEKLKEPICAFIDHQIWERNECEEND